MRAGDPKRRVDLHAPLRAGCVSLPLSVLVESSFFVWIDRGQFAYSQDAKRRVFRSRENPDLRLASNDLLYNYESSGIAYRVVAANHSGGQ